MSRHDFQEDLDAVARIDAISLILDVLCRSTGMGFAAVARVTDDRWIVCQARDQIDFGLGPGGELKVGTTICQEVRDKRMPVVIDHVAQDEAFCGHPTPAMYGFQSYVSMPIIRKNGDFFGTLCAIDPKPAKVNTPETIGTFRLFAELIAFHLDADERLAGADAVRLMNDALEERLAERSATLRLYENIVQSDPAPMCAFDTEFRLVAFNRAHNAEFFRVNGFYTQIGDIFSDLFVPEQRPIMRGLMGRALAGETFTVVEKFGNPVLGVPHWEITYTPLRDEPGKIIGAFHHAVDISTRLRAETELVAAQDALRQSQKMEAISNLSGGMSHDFNNMLGVIIGSLDLAVPLVKDNHQASELVEEAISAAVSSAELNSRLLAFARRQSLRPERIAPNDLISGIIRLLRRTLGENIEIVLDLANDLWPVIADSAQLQASLTNLATNARDAMPNGGRLSITTVNRYLDADYTALNVEETAGSYAAIEVSDTGTGMTSEVVQHVFDPFYTTKELGKGTGLGLSMVFGFIKQSGGHINVYSEPGVGTTFRLYLPRAAEEAVPAAVKRSILSVHGSGESVLAVEDNPTLRQVVMLQLSELGYNPIEADGPLAALAVLERRTIDLLFTDVVMPGPLDGIALARQVLERWPTVKVVLTSGFTGKKFDDLVDAQGNAVRLISKPYRLTELATLLRRVLQG